MTAITRHRDENDFESLYLQLRQKERRVYSDEEVAALPGIAASHPHAREWELRKLSAEKLVAYIQKQKLGSQDRSSVKILEIGCGNGWLSHQLSGIAQSHVIGIDINFNELQQAARVFQNRANLHFLYSSPASEIFEKGQFDIIVFAASIQYFQSLKDTLGNTIQLLNANGEIHIIDSFFYPASGLQAARQRSLLYFEAAGFPEMADWYFHHSWEDLDAFNHSLLYDPAAFFNKLLMNKIPFPWIRIKR